jgi:hypothetical protein
MPQKVLICASFTAAVTVLPLCTQAAERPRPDALAVQVALDRAGIHGTPEPQTVSRTQSHGCIRLTNWDAAKLAQMVRAGTPAVLQE